MSAERLTLRVQLGYPGFTLDVDEQLPLDGVTALFGPSGSGKSTLLRAIAGFERSATGRVALGDELWLDSDTRCNLKPHRRPVGLMFQDARLFGHLRVGGNLDFADRRATGEAGFDRATIVDAFELGPLLDRRVDALSGGERQRVALARTLLARPRLLLLDEPLAALDRERKAEILPYLEQLPRRFRLPTLYVSHAIDEVARLAERVVVIADGRVQAQGPTAAILERIDLQPITGHFEAGALVEAVVTGHDARLALTHVEIDGEELTLPSMARASTGDRLRLRIRARDVSIATRRPEQISIRNVLPATIVEIAPEPETAYAEVILSLRRTHLRARLTRASVEDLELAPGMPVFALVKSVSFDRRLI